MVTSNLMLISFLVYGMILISIAWFAHKRSSSSSDFLIGNRGINYWVTALSAHASDMSSWLFLGLPMAVFANGLTELSTALGLVIGMALTWLFIAPRLRTRTEKSQSVTISHFFAHSVGDDSRLIAITAAIASLFFFVFYIASGLKGMSVLLSTLFSLEAHLALLLSATLVIAYTVIGGFLAIAITDAFQAVFLLLVIILVPTVAALSLDEGLSFAANVVGSAQSFSVYDAITNGFGWGLGYFGMLHVLTKFMGIRSVADIKKSMCVGISWQILALSAATSVGLVGRVMYPTGIEQWDKYLFVTMSFDVFPLAWCGIIMCGVLAATLSTVDSQVIVCAGVISQDLANPKRDAARIWWARLAIVVVTLTAAFIAYVNPQNLFQIVHYAWSGQGASFGPLVICTLYCRWIQKWSAFAGMLIGGSMAAVWPLTALPLQHAPMIPGFAVGLLTILLGSLVEQRLSK